MAAGMLGRRAKARSDRGPYNKGHLDLASKHVPEFPSLVINLVHAHPKKVDKHQLGDWPKTGDGCPDCCADKGRLTDRRVQHSPPAKFLCEPNGDSQGPTPLTAPGCFKMGKGGPTRHILSQQDDRRVPAHFQTDGFIDRLTKSHCPC